MLMYTISQLLARWAKMIGDSLPIYFLICHHCKAGFFDRSLQRRNPIVQHKYTSACQINFMQAPTHK